MAFTGATGLAGAGAAGLSAGAGGSNSTIAKDFSTFLTLLTTQLQHQDPMDPTDSNEFTKQIVSFAGVEQQIAVNENLKSLHQTMTLNNTTNAVNYLGKTATIPTDTYRYTNSSEGQAHVFVEFEYGIDADVSKARISIYDKNDKVVYSEDADVQKGMNTLTFPYMQYKNAEGTEFPSGDYTLKVEMLNDQNGVIKNDDGDSREVPIFLTAPIRAVDTTSGEPMFTVGSTIARQSDILQLTQ